MAKDYAKVSQSRRQSPSWGVKLFLVTGVFVGGYLAATFYDYDTLKHSLSDKVAQTLPRKPVKKHVKAKPVDLPKPKFEFYTLLPKQRVSDAKPVSAKPVGRAKVGPSLIKGTPAKQYLLQAASFKRQADADKLKAELILKGYEAGIVEFSNGSTTWYRVNLGPFDSLKGVVAAQTQLAKQTHINGMVKRIV